MEEQPKPPSPAAERSRRYRARKRGEPVPKRRPGPPPSGQAGREFRLRDENATLRQELESARLLLRVATERISRRRADTPASSANDVRGLCRELLGYLDRTDAVADRPEERELLRDVFAALAARDETALEELRAEARSALDDLTSGEATLAGAAQGRVRDKHKAVTGSMPDTAKPSSRRAGPKPTRQVIKVANLRRVVDKISAYQTAFDTFTEVDPKLTDAEAVRLMGDLSRTIAALQRLNRLIKERAE